MVSAGVLQLPGKTGNHRALADIRESIQELRYYRQAIFVPPPGPDSETAKAIAAATTGTPPPDRAEPPSETSSSLLIPEKPGQVVDD